ncbi:MAG: hypothetical protein ACI9QN_000130 [Arcticibacterium sp.]|jgi:hypothetical protein
MSLRGFKHIKFKPGFETGLIEAEVIKGNED